MTDDHRPESDEAEADRLAAAVRRETTDDRAAAPAPAWSGDWPEPPRGGSDPTTPGVELDPEKLARMIPRSPS